MDDYILRMHMVLLVVWLKPPKIAYSVSDMIEYKIRIYPIVTQ
jgi:hypothetical protein